MCIKYYVSRTILNNRFDKPKSRKNKIKMYQLSIIEYNTAMNLSMFGKRSSQKTKTTLNPLVQYVDSPKSVQYYHWQDRSPGSPG